MFNLRPKEGDLYDWIVQGWLVETHIEVDEQERPQLEVEDPKPKVGPSITPLGKLAS